MWTGVCQMSKLCCFSMRKCNVLRQMAVLQKSCISCRCSCELACNFLGTTHWEFSWIRLITPKEFADFVVCCDLLLGVSRLFHLCPWFSLFYLLKSITRHAIFSPWICCLDQRFQFGEQKQLCWCLVDTRLFYFVLSDTFFYMLAYDGKILNSVTSWLLAVLNFSFGFYCSCQSCPTD